mmetsp:Transcript_51910/g.129177  ORF Transcript_51910/g.129177 Transcript_51910/m.129177 type:complete len:208 (-) Transcript_51910:38-661(-)
MRVVVDNLAALLQRGAHRLLGLLREARGVDDALGLLLGLVREVADARGNLLRVAERVRGSVGRVLGRARRGQGGSGAAQALDGRVRDEARVLHGRGRGLHGQGRGGVAANLRHEVPARLLEVRDLRLELLLELAELLVQRRDTLLCCVVLLLGHLEAESLLGVTLLQHHGPPRHRQSNHGDHGKRRSHPDNHHLVAPRGRAALVPWA